VRLMDFQILELNEDEVIIKFWDKLLTLGEGDGFDVYGKLLGRSSARHEEPRYPVELE
jgi:hypothetical protein